MGRKKWEAALDTAGRLHLLLLRFLAGILTLFLILTPLSGIWVISQMRKYGVFRDFWGYLRHLSSAGSLIVFALCYLGLITILFWLCIICRRLRMMKRLIVWSMLWVPFLNYGLAWYVRSLAYHLPDPLSSFVGTWRGLSRFSLF